MEVSGRVVFGLLMSAEEKGGGERPGCGKLLVEGPSYPVHFVCETRSTGPR